MDSFGDQLECARPDKMAMHKAARSAVFYLVTVALECYTKALKRASILDALERSEAHCAWLETA